MKSLLSGFILLVASLPAQTVPKQGSLDRLNEDLISLSFVPQMTKEGLIVNPLHMSYERRDSLIETVRNQSPAFYEIMLRFAVHVQERCGKYVIVPWSLSYVLTSALAGRQLPEPKVKVLTAAIISSLDTAVAYRGRSRPLRNSAEFRISIKGAIDALLALGVTAANVEIIIENLINAGEWIAYAQGPVFRPL